MQSESTIDDIIKTVERFRILSVGRSGVGKSSLINSVFGIKGAHVAHFKPGEADIYQEFVSEENPHFVLHDSKGFEPGDVENFAIAREFIVEHSKPDLELKKRIHALWLCTETPTAGGRVFEKGDENLLQLVHESATQIPVVIVFTQYDRLIRTKEEELKEDYPNIDPATLKEQSEKEAQKAFKICLSSLEGTMKRLNIHQMPPVAKVSVHVDYKEGIPALVEDTRSIVQKRLQEDAWIMWAMAQRASLPLKIEACTATGLNYYKRVLTGSVPGLGKMLLRKCLMEVHKDIVKCWNFKGDVLESEEFNQLMLLLVQDIRLTPDVATPAGPNIDKIVQFVTLVTAASAPIAPPVAILGLTYLFVQWLSTAVLENVHTVQRLLLAYIVDLINILRELFDLTLQPAKVLVTTWKELQEAFETYEESLSRQRNHRSICSLGDQIVSPNNLGEKIRDLVKYLKK